MNERTFAVESEQQRAHLSAFVLRQAIPFQVGGMPMKYDDLDKAILKAIKPRPLGGNAT